MKKFAFTFIGIVYFLNICQAQLNKLCPISSKVYDKQKIKGMNLLLNTKDCTPYFFYNGKTRRTASVQLVKALQPFPPLWYQMGNQEADTLGFFETTFLFNIRIQENGGNLTFFNSYPGKFFGSLSIDTATLEPTDTLTKYINSPANNEYIIDPHDYQIDADGNKLIANHLLVKIDARCLSGLEKDSSIDAYINEILILNKNDSIVFTWNPLKHLSVCEMNWDYKEASITFGDIINWSHINSLRFSNDGNILYSFRHIGVGKINKTTGDIIWKLGGKDSLNSIPLSDNSNYFLQHDFLQNKNGLYSLFSNGDNAHQYLNVLVFDIDDKKKIATLVKNYRPQPVIYSKSMGNYECKNDTCITCYGAYFVENSTKPHEIAQVLIGNKIVASIKAPDLNYPYKVLQTKWAALQRRPKVVLKKNVLYSDSLMGLHDYTWYKIDSTTATPVGIGKTYAPLKSGNYVVEAQQGAGIFKSFLVSNVFSFIKKKK